MRYARSLLILLFSCLWASSAFAQDRHALVVGIDRYDNIPSLQKAGNDARAVSDALEQAGFAVTTLIDSDRRDLSRALSRFSASLSPGDEAVFYFAGHGVEVEGRNYLLPADVPGMRPGEELFLINESLAADDVLSAIQSSGARVSVMILDACRDNPFPQTGTRSLGRSRGLARLEAPAGTFILFSAGIGQAALDRLSDEDPDPNSVFTRALLPLLDEPGLPIHEVARRLRREVQDMAESVGHVQRPAYYDEVTGEFVIQAAATLPPEPQPEVPPAPLADPTPPQNAMAPAGPCDTALAMWQVVEGTRSASVLTRFFDTYRDSCPVLAELAAARMATLETSQPGPEAAPPAAETHDTPTASAPDVSPARDTAPSGPCTVSGATVVALLRGSLNLTRLERLQQEHPACGAFSRLASSLQAELEAAPNARRMRDLRPIAVATDEEALNLTREDRIEIQQMLSNLGFETGTPDGVFGPATRRAIAGFLGLVGSSDASSLIQNPVAPASGYLSAPTLSLLRQAQDIAPQSINGTWKIELNRFGNEVWLRANDPENTDSELRDKPLEAIEVVIENGEIASFALQSATRWDPITPGTIHSISLDPSGRLQIDMTSHFLFGNRSENRRLDIEVTLRPGHLTTVERREEVGRYDDAFFAVLHITRFMQEQVFE